MFPRRKYEFGGPPSLPQTAHLSANPGQDMGEDTGRWCRLGRGADVALAAMFGRHAIVSRMKKA